MRVTNVAQKEQQRVDADLLIPGRGDPVSDASLIHSEGEILYAGPRSELSDEHSKLQAAAKVKVLMPGLWDCHVHLFGIDAYAADMLYATPAVVCGARIARDLVATLNAGYTSVRELAGYGADLERVVSEGWLPGPRIYSSVSILSPTAGHGDARTVPACDFHDAVSSRGLPAAVCDGVEECLRAVRTQVRRGAKVIKVATSGGIADAGDDVLNQQFSDAELQAIVDEASRWNMSVAAHCHGKAGIMAALRSGCHTIEHGSFLDDEAVQLMLDKNAILVATRGTVEAIAKLPDLWTPQQYQKILQVKDEHAKSYRRAVRAGVRVALGTDLLISSDRVDWHHGMNAVELQYAVEAGLKPLQAIEAATATAPETLGLRAPKSGWLKKGYDADFISLDVNPLLDVRILQKAENIVNIWKGGKWVKRHGAPINILG